MAELDKFKRRMIRAVARLLLHEKKPEEEMWAELNQETGCDCKLLWQRMRALTMKKLSRLLMADDRANNISAVAQLSHTDWLLFDLVLVHDKIDVISASGRTHKTEYRALVDLFSLVQRFEIEGKSGDDLADAWSEATLHYNSQGHQVTPMLLQRRWYQLKETSRDRFYKFWTTYRGNAKLLDKAKENSPTALQIAIARRYPQIVVEPFPDWEEQIKIRLVILPEEFENKLRAKVIPKPAVAEDPDIVLMEPVVETIDLDADSESEENTREKANDSLESEPVSNVDLNPEITVKKEPLDDTYVDGLSNVKIIETTHITQEEESIVSDNTPASKKHLQDIFRNVTENVEREESQIENAESNAENEENSSSHVHSSDILQKHTVPKIRNTTRTIEPDATTGITDRKILSKEKHTTKKTSTSFLNSAKIDLAKLVAMVDDTGLEKQKRPRQKTNVLSGYDPELDKETPDTNNEKVDNRGIDKQIIRQESNKTIDDTITANNSIIVDLEALEDLDKQIAHQKVNVPSGDVTVEKSMKIDLLATENNKEFLNEQIQSKNGTDNIKNSIRTDSEESLTSASLVNDVLCQNRKITNCNDTNNVKDSTKLYSVEKRVFNEKDLSVHEVQTQSKNVPSVAATDDVIEIKTDNCAIKLVSDELLLRDIKAEIKTENIFPEMPSEIDDEGIEYVDDGIILLEEEDDNSSDTFNKAKSDDSHDTLNNGVESSEVPKFDLKLLMDPVVYTTKIDKMTCLKFNDASCITDVDLLNNIVKESKPVSKKSINVQEIKQADNVFQNSSVDEKRDNDDLFKKENVDDEYGDECENEYDDEIQDCQKVKMSSCLLQKPRNRNYNPIQLCKNPDFNTRLKRLTVGFLSSNRNRQFLKACKPMTIDVCRGFESQLINGTLYLKETRNVTLEKDIHNNVSEQTVSVIPSAMPAQSLLDSTKISIDDILMTTSPTEGHELEKKPNEKDDLLIGRNKVINLPDMDYVRRINQKLLTAEVTPIRINNNGSCAPPVQLLSSSEPDEHNANNIDIREKSCETEKIGKGKLNSDASDNLSDVQPQAINTNEIHLQTRDPVTFEVFSHKASQEATPPINLAQRKDHELRNIVEQRKNKTKGYYNNKLRKTCLSPGQVPWRPFHSSTISWSSQYPEPDKYDFLLTTDTLLKVLKLLAGKEVEIHNKDKKIAKKLRKEFENEYINNLQARKDNEKHNQVINKVGNIQKKKIKKPKINIIEGVEKAKNTRKRKKDFNYCCWCRQRMQSLKQKRREETPHLCPLPICHCCCKQEFFSYIYLKNKSPNKASHISPDLFYNQKTCSASIPTHSQLSDVYSLHETIQHKDTSSQCAIICEDNKNISLNNLTDTVVLSDDEDTVTNSAAQVVDFEKKSELMPSVVRTNTNDDRMQIANSSIDQFKDLPQLTLKPKSTDKDTCDDSIATHPPPLVPMTLHKPNITFAAEISQTENIQLKNLSQVPINEHVNVLNNICIENSNDVASDLLNISTAITEATKNERVNNSNIRLTTDTEHIQQSINMALCGSPSLCSQVSVNNTLCEYRTSTDNQYVRALSITHQQSSAVSDEQSHIVIDGTNIGTGPTIITQKMSGKDRVIYLNGLQISRSPTCSPIFLGKNKILLTSVKFPSKNRKVLNDNRITAPEVTPTEALPDGVHLVMLSTGELTYTSEPGLELNSMQVAAMAPIIAAVQQQLDMALPSNVASNTVSVANIKKNEIHVNIKTPESNGNITEQLDTINTNAITLNVQNSTEDNNLHFIDNNTKSNELNTSNKDDTPEETSPEESLKCTEPLTNSRDYPDHQINHESNTGSHNKENIDQIAENIIQEETTTETALQDQDNEKNHESKGDDASKDLTRIKLNQELQTLNKDQKVIGDGSDSINDNIINKEAKQNDSVKTADCVEKTTKGPVNNSKKGVFTFNTNDNGTKVTEPESNNNLNKNTESNIKDREDAIVDDDNFVRNIKKQEKTNDKKNECCLKSDVNLDQVQGGSNAGNGQLLTADDNGIGSENSMNNNRKTILSDLMAMSGISSEDITPATSSLTCESGKQSGATPYMLSSRANDDDLIQLSPVTSLDELKYACDQNGKFYKLDLDTGVLLTINVCIKQKVKAIRKKNTKIAFDPKSIIDLTDDMEITKSDDNMKSPNSMRASPKRSLQTDECINTVKPIKLFKAIRPSILRTTETKSASKCNMKNRKSSIKPTSKRKRKQNNTYPIEAKIDLVDSDGLVEEYLLDNFDSDSSQEKVRDINRNSSNNSDDSDDEPLAKKIMRNKIAAEKLARFHGVADERSIVALEDNIKEKHVEPTDNIESLPEDISIDSETEPNVDFLETDDETSQDDCILGV